MKQQVIKLDHDFTALHGQRAGDLVAVHLVRDDQLSSFARCHATEYQEGALVSPGEELKHGVVKGEIRELGTKHGKLPVSGTGTFVRLCFIGSRGIPFMIYLRFKTATWKRYENMVQEKFTFEIKGEEEQTKLELVDEET